MCRPRQGARACSCLDAATGCPNRLKHAGHLPFGRELKHLPPPFLYIPRAMLQQEGNDLRVAILHGNLQRTLVMLAFLPHTSGALQQQPQEAKVAVPCSHIHRVARLSRHAELLEDVPLPVVHNGQAVVCQLQQLHCRPEAQLQRGPVHRVHAAHLGRRGGQRASPMQVADAQRRATANQRLDLPRIVVPDGHHQRVAQAGTVSRPRWVNQVLLLGQKALLPGALPGRDVRSAEHAIHARPGRGRGSEDF
mmetsp:Transcript_36157/g.111279  ORF Transcript_36157/g.111279 Transcript_36157/m.111279 type:complete len:250 (-) Transcript_36157:30-779(-)